ncbi:MAG TPA: hypothetical protein VEW04_09635 [Allosphingosinicella sp.]|nr:hypothetical protein [Allosphingosinicella sp.]
MSDHPASELPPPRLSLGVTGHRDGNAAFIANRAAIEGTLRAVFAAVDGSAAKLSSAKTRLHALLAPGADMMAMELALEQNWEVVAPLPFGLELNIALNCRDVGEDDARALLHDDGEPSPQVAAQAAAMRDMAGRVQLFQLAEEDDHVADLFIAHLEKPDDRHAATEYSISASERAAVAARIMIEQSDLLVAIWDGATPGSIGGTRHSIESALYHGVPVIWISAVEPASIYILEGPDALERLGPPQSGDEVATFVAAIASPADLEDTERAARFHSERWHKRSSRLFHAYRRVETIFGGAGAGRFFRSLVEHYETPDAIAEGSGAELLGSARALSGTDSAFVERLKAQILRRFAWADGLSTYLSDAYRGGMVTNFLLSAMAVISGVAYLPLVGVDWKWPFAATELLLLLAIVAITTVGRKRRWHGRWLETRRVAEYLRHAPILLLLGVARPVARWPQGSGTQWPEFYARQALRATGLPKIVVTQEYLRSALVLLLARHSQQQRDYHRQKAAKLVRVHHRIDRLSEGMFVLAIITVSVYLMVIAAAYFGLVPAQLGELLAKPLTFLGLALPALGGAFAGIRYLGDFDRFASISEITAEKLEGLSGRIEKLLSGAEPSLRYAQVASLAHALDDVVIAEIESWQAVFAVKNMAVPV